MYDYLWVMAQANLENELPRYSEIIENKGTSIKDNRTGNEIIADLLEKLGDENEII